MLSSPTNGNTRTPTRSQYAPREPPNSGTLSATPTNANLEELFPEYPDVDSGDHLQVKGKPTIKTNMAPSPQFHVSSPQRSGLTTPRRLTAPQLAAYTGEDEVSAWGPGQVIIHGPGAVSPSGQSSWAAPGVPPAAAPAAWSSPTVGHFPSNPGQQDGFPPASSFFSAEIFDGLNARTTFQQQPGHSLPPSDMSQLNVPSGPTPSPSSTEALARPYPQAFANTAAPGYPVPGYPYAYPAYPSFPVAYTGSYYPAAMVPATAGSGPVSSHPPPNVQQRELTFAARPPPLPRTIAISCDRYILCGDAGKSTQGSSGAPQLSGGAVPVRPVIRRTLAEVASRLHVRISYKRASVVATPAATGQNMGAAGVSPEPQEEGCEVEIAGSTEAVEVARVDVMRCLDEAMGLHTAYLNLEPGNPNMFHNILADRRRRLLHAIMRRTATNVYFPSPFVVQSAEPNGREASIVITGRRGSVEEAKRLLEEVVNSKCPTVMQHTITFPSHKLEWMLANRRDLISKIMWDNGTFILFPVTSSNPTEGQTNQQQQQQQRIQNRIVTIYGDDRVFIERTVRMLTLVSCECYIASIDLTQPINNLVYDATPYFGNQFDPHQSHPPQPRKMELDWESRLTEIANSTRAVVYLAEQGQTVEILGVEATCKSAYGMLSETEELKPFVQRASFRIGLPAEHRDFIRGKKDGKLTRVIKGSGCNVRVEDDRNMRTISVVVEHHDMQAVTEGVSLIEEELPAELAFNLPERFHKQAIGFGGRRIQTIMRRREAYVKFASAEEVARTGGFDVGEVGDNVIVRTPARNTRNMELVRRDVEATVGYVDPTGAVSPAMHSFVSVVIRVPRRHHRRILARPTIFSYKPGEEPADILAEIEQKTGTKIKFPERELGTDEVSIEGPQHGVEVAANVLASLVPIAISVPLAAASTQLLRGAEFQSIVETVAKEMVEIKVFFAAEGGSRERRLSSELDNSAGSSGGASPQLDGQPPPASQARAVGYRPETSDGINEVLIEGEPQRLENVMKTFLTPWFADRGIALPQRQTSFGFTQFDYRILESVVLRDQRDGPRFMPHAMQNAPGEYQQNFNRGQRPLSEYQNGDFDQRGGQTNQSHARRTSEPPPNYFGPEYGMYQPQYGGHSQQLFGYGPRGRYYDASGKPPPAEARRGGGSFQGFNSQIGRSISSPGMLSGYGPGSQFQQGGRSRVRPQGPFQSQIEGGGQHQQNYPGKSQTQPAQRRISSEQTTVSHALDGAPKSSPRPPSLEEKGQEPYEEAKNTSGSSDDEVPAAPNGDVHVYNVLKKASLTKYHRKFAEQEVDYNTFLTLTDKDLQELGITTFGARRRILGTVQDALAGQYLDRSSSGSNTRAQSESGSAEPPNQDH
ncbi:hypothetical protein M427DRAFT_133734 [Gonapodya prolifera JEL478]|uniref:SAM domain-containing protein n=1 Tax=Gonapodya prolifera (strain JEL478) TaxID=1344416 RepID=A0A139AJK6_GONPJ|nr:hypothetical protein M427DRAFT_133734 [Gonapodya prolifera JEL478]|eukprot:KXS16939.1 hypothetical protein M427DRAFT_133734 [Gonapodya prolifera JEL478]